MGGGQIHINHNPMSGIVTGNGDASTFAGPSIKKKSKKAGVFVSGETTTVKRSPNGLGVHHYHNDSSGLNYMGTQGSDMAIMTQ